MAKLDPREEHFWIPSGVGAGKNFLRYLPACSATHERRAVLYVHGATFPSALSIAYRFDGQSWRDDLIEAGYDVWGLDFLGFGESDRYPAMELPAEDNPPLGRAKEACRQLEAAARFIIAHQQLEQISIIAHSWGTIVAGLFAGRHPELVGRLVFFAPITLRRAFAHRSRTLGAWGLVTLEQQWKRFTEDVPAGQRPVLSRRHFESWGKAYLATDSESCMRLPASVKTPSGAIADIIAAWSGELAYEPARIKAPIAVIRGEWDSLVTDADARWLFDALSGTPNKRDVKIGRATHLMHLEDARYALYHETRCFLDGRDRAEMAELNDREGQENGEWSR